MLLSMSMLQHGTCSHFHLFQLRAIAFLSNHYWLTDSTVDRYIFPYTLQRTHTVPA